MLASTKSSPTNSPDPEDQGLVVSSHDEAEAAMAIVALGQCLSKENEARLARYRKALVTWALKQREPKRSLQILKLRHGIIQIELGRIYEGPYVPLVTIKPNPSV